MNDTPSRLPLTRLSLLLLIVALAVIWFVPLGLRHLVPSDEGRYAEMAREMFVTGDWITPRYNGYKYFEKPPLQTWANALTFAWFGIGEWQARLYTALTGFAGVLLIGYTGARVFNGVTGFCTAVILASSPYWNLMAHFNTLDMALSFWMELTLCALLLAQRPGLPTRHVRLWMWLCWGAMAAALLSKGLVGVILPGAVLVLYSLITRDWALWKRLYIGSGLIVFLIVAAPWFVLVQMKNPEFFNFFFIVQQFKRYLTPEQNRPGPLYYFVPVLIVGFLPWLSIVYQSTRHALKLPRQPNGFAPVPLLLIWTLFIFLFFSASHSKLLSYTLPIAPSIALVLGIYLPLVTRVQWHRHLIGYAVFLIAAAFGAVFLCRAGSAHTPNALYRAFQVWVYAGLAVAFAVTLIAIWLNRRSTIAAAVALGTAWLMLGTIAGTGHDVFGRESSGVRLVPAVKAAMAKLPPDTPFYSIAKLDHTMPFYLGHTMIMVQEADELGFGVATEPQKWVPTIDEWVKRWDAGRYALALMPPARYEELLARHVPMQVIAQDDRRVIVQKPVPAP
ncbi:MULTISPECIES: glycosyltransferase family 39 protein [unclassified Caballeronia]|uniref:glycosyltransferase family 39 protein n=1 Tax=unclassified Caballeronia TaxID=2646786 RepID=UPI00285A91F1|nr:MULTISPECIES: glycosyltransferase family 39 protein [unclassified Caballeronia]MDR5750581.1 glycosyltransferase family 39 protein [Caballeronia sp. LZ024]MDR5842386.1 glycosyltransferase family 39 protein [Caballeronia sp. LZ031]